MNSVSELLAQKEKDLSRVHKEVECLRIAAPLLLDEVDETTPVTEDNLILNMAPDHPVIPPKAETAEESTVQKVMGIFRKRPA